MGPEYLDELFEDTKQIIIVVFQKFEVNFKLEEKDVSGVEPSPQFILIVCSCAAFLEDYLKLKKLGIYKKGDAKSCYDTYQKNSNPMGFLILLSKLMPALECPHTILTSGPVKKRLVTKKAKLLLLNFLASVTLMCDDICNRGSEDDANAQEQNTVDCGLCGMKVQVCCCAPIIAHISGLGHNEKVVEKLKKENSLISLQNFGYFVNRTQPSTSNTKKKKKINQLREGVRKMSTNEKEQLAQTSSSNREEESPDGKTEAQTSY